MAITSILALVVIGVLFAVGGQIVGSIQETATAGSLAENLSGQGAQGLTNAAALNPVLGTVLMATVIIGAIMAVVLVVRRTNE